MIGLNSSMVSALECEAGFLRSIYSSGELTSVRYMDRLYTLTRFWPILDIPWLTILGHHDLWIKALNKCNTCHQRVLSRLSLDICIHSKSKPRYDIRFNVAHFLYVHTDLIHNNNSFIHAFRFNRCVYILCGQCSCVCNILVCVF